MRALALVAFACALLLPRAVAAADCVAPRARGGTVVGLTYCIDSAFESVVAARMSRRSLLRGGAATAGAAVALTGADVLARAVPVHADGHGPRGNEKGYGRPADDPRLGFEGIAPSTEDRVVVPPGYRADVLIAWGDPVSAGPAFKQDASNSADDQAKQWGMHNDGIVYFPIGRSSSHGVIVQNHEYTDDGLLFTDGAVPWTAAKTAKSQNAHGVGIIEVKRRRGRWEVVRPSKYGRRITAQTAIRGGSVAECLDWLARHVAVGARHLIVLIGSLQAHPDSVAEQLLPALKELGTP